MFTGIVEERGRIVSSVHGDNAAVLTVQGGLVVEDLVVGASVAVDGCCLTVIDVDADSSTFKADVMAETLDKTTLGVRQPGDLVNLERALAVDSRLGGHLVQGHVDGTGTICERRQTPVWDLVRISLPAALAGYVAAKGSIAVDGVSLTVVDVDDDPAARTFSVALVPTTRRLTTLGQRAVGDLVNLEVDVIAKYVRRLLVEREVLA